MAHFTYSYAWWVRPLARILSRLGVSRYRNASIIAHGIKVRLQRS